jgi:glycolate oxidase FAD binding subunit
MTLALGTDLRARIDALLGSDGTEEGPPIQIAGARPRLRALPATAEETGACLQAAGERGASVAVWGGGTQQRIGHLPQPIDLVLDLQRMHAVVEWEPADLTVCVEAGATLSSVQEHLAGAGQQLAIDAPAAGLATLGGLIASNTCGPRRWLYGSWRDHIIGMHMALPNGEVIKSGGRVVKNVQGYDLAKLFIGSIGTLGVICRINLKVAPLPPERRLFVARGELGACCSLVEAIASAPLRVSTLDLLDAAAGRSCGIAGPEWAVLVLVEGTTAVLDDQIGRLRALASQRDLTTEESGGESLAAIWPLWLDLNRVDGLGPSDALVSMRLLPTRLEDGLRAIQRAAGECGVEVVCWARAGNGIVFARVSAAPGSAVVALPSFQRELMRFHHSITITAGDPAVASASLPWGLEPEGIELMRALKRRFDPRTTLQAGRFVGGI